jgi:hypothetical protein
VALVLAATLASSCYWITPYEDLVSGQRGGADGGADAATGGQVAVAASAFLESLGVNTHMGQNADSLESVISDLQYTGIRELRDANFDAADFITLRQRTGVRVDYLMNQGGQDMAEGLAEAVAMNEGGALLAIEGPEEPNNQVVIYDGGSTDAATTFLPAAEYQRDLYGAVHAETRLSGIPVFNSSEGGGAEPDNVGLQFDVIPPDAGTTMPTGTKYADYANAHNYVSGHLHAYEDNVAWSSMSPTLNGDWDGFYVEYGHTWNRGFTGYSNDQLTRLPRVTTETGWTTSGQSNPLTPDQQGRLFLDLYLGAFAQGVAYTFIYMLRDDPSQGYWGLFETDDTPKTSATDVRSLTTILADTPTSASFTPGRLDYSIADEPATVHDLLLEKSDGTFELAVWDEHMAGGSDAVAVTFAHPQVKVLVYDPTLGTTATQTLGAVSRVSLVLTDHPVILELPPPP